uniref:DC_STAMP domain-containing protein n=1 Tax=Heterorhabditis bacteriophora TaxID=37862 RepID=A0A1I7X1P6_HETBA
MMTTCNHALYAIVDVFTQYFSQLSELILPAIYDQFTVCIQQQNEQLARSTVNCLETLILSNGERFNDVMWERTVDLFRRLFAATLPKSLVVLNRDNFVLKLLILIGNIYFKKLLKIVFSFCYFYHNGYTVLLRQRTMNCVHYCLLQGKRAIQEFGEKSEKRRIMMVSTSQNLFLKKYFIFNIIVITFAAIFFLLSFIFVTASDSCFDIHLLEAYDKFSENVEALMLETGATETISTKQKNPLLLYISMSVFFSFLSAMLVFPNFRYADMYSNAQAVAALPINLTKDQLDILRVYFVIVAVLLRVAVRKYHLQAHLNTAYIKLRAIQRETGHVRNIHLQSMVKDFLEV